ncbi:MAG: inosine/xanthosine triphosphatase [Alphaproteobacteria bacterium]|nr:inosine/xanthosine triphosphatase [Alphaproteobacteria bacterium]
MTKVLVGTENKEKVDGVRQALELLLGRQVEVTGESVPSGVPEQPKSEEENRAGAFSRASRLFRDRPGYDFYIGIESGLKSSLQKQGLFIMRDWVCIINEKGQQAEGSGGGNYLPKPVCDLIHNGATLPKAMRQVFPDYTIGKGGALAYLTRGALDRSQEVCQVVFRAMIPFLHPVQYADYLNRDIVTR